MDARGQTTIALVQGEAQPGARKRRGPLDLLRRQLDLAANLFVGRS